MSTQSYTDIHYAPTPVNQVQVVDLHEIQHKYIIVGEVEGLGVSTNGMRKKAAELGANAISIPTHDQNGVAYAQAIKYTD